MCPHEYVYHIGLQDCTHSEHLQDAIAQRMQLTSPDRHKDCAAHGWLQQIYGSDGGD